MSLGDLLDPALQFVGALLFDSKGGSGGAVRVDVSRLSVTLRVQGETKWRYGWLNLTPGAEEWRRFRRLPGRRIPLPGLRIGPDRRPDFFEPWWIQEGSRVFSATANGLELEMSVTALCVEALREASARGAGRPER